MASKMHADGQPSTTAREKVFPGCRVESSDHGISCDPLEMAAPPSSPSGLIPTPSPSGAGADESFAKSLFAGSPAEGLVFPFPEPSRAEVDEINGVLDGVRRFASKHIDAARIDREGVIPLETLAALRELGIFGLVVPKAYGGSGFGVGAYARIVQELAGLDGSIAHVVSAHQSLGLGPILHFGTEEMKAKYLPRCARGETLAAFALVETGAGSDAGAIQTRAERVGDAFAITGEKIWVTSGAVADVFTVFARTSPSEDGAKPRLTAFLVDRGESVTSGPVAPTLGLRGASTSNLVLASARAGSDQVLGEVGRGDSGMERTSPMIRGRHACSRSHATKGSAAATSPCLPRSASRLTRPSAATSPSSRS